MKYRPEAISGIILLSILSTASCAPTIGVDDQRRAKNLQFFDYVQPEVDYGGYGVDGDDYVSLALEENDISRTIPARKRFGPEYNSPIYYIRLPPQPYMFVPGLGYVSQPPANPISPFVNVPVSFVSNGKPSSIYQWTGGIELPTVAPTLKPKPTRKPVKPDSTIHRLPGQFAFNGRPEEIFVLRDSYNSLYGDVLQNLYP